MNQNQACHIIPSPEPVAQLIHEPTHTVISVYQTMNWFQRWMIKWCFGLKYQKI